LRAAAALMRVVSSDRVGPPPWRALRAWPDDIWPEQAGSVSAGRRVARRAVGRDRWGVRAGCRRLLPCVPPAAPFAACCGLARDQLRQRGQPRAPRRLRRGWWRSPASAVSFGPRERASRTQW